MVKRPSVRFDNPPVVEVICGVLFDAPRAIAGMEMAFFWQQVSEQFPEWSEHPPIPATIEYPEGAAIVQEATLLQMPPIRRKWLVSRDGRMLIQVQEDRFLLNWKKAELGDTYPSYEAVIERFEHYLREFRGFLMSRQNGMITYRQYELTYVNHIGPENGLRKAPMTKVLVDHSSADIAGRFLPEPETFNWSTSYRLEDGSGRLHIKAQPAIRQSSGERILRLDMMARGMPSDTSEEARGAWFNMAHTWITHGFCDVTNRDLQSQIWKRTA